MSMLGKATGKALYAKGKHPVPVTITKPKRKTYTKPKAEWKAIDTAVTLNQNSTGSVVLINGCARGDDISEREGRQLNIRSIEIKGFTYVTPGTGIDQNHRVLLVLDKEANGAAPAITDILGSVSPIALRNLDNRKRFKIIMDKTFQMNASGEPTATRLFKKYIKLNYNVQFNSGNAGTVADIENGALYMVGLGNVAAGATAGTASAYTRVRFTE